MAEATCAAAVASVAGEIGLVVPPLPPEEEVVVEVVCVVVELEALGADAPVTFAATTAPLVTTASASLVVVAAVFTFRVFTVVPFVDGFGFVVDVFLIVFVFTVVALFLPVVAGRGFSVTFCVFFD